MEKMKLIFYPLKLILQPIPLKARGNEAYIVQESMAIEKWLVKALQ